MSRQSWKYQKEESKPLGANFVDDAERGSKAPGTRPVDSRGRGILHVLHVASNRADAVDVVWHHELTLTAMADSVQPRRLTRSVTRPRRSARLSVGQNATGHEVGTSRRKPRPTVFVELELLPTKRRRALSAQAVALAETGVADVVDKGLRTRRSTNRTSLTAPRSTDEPFNAVSEKTEKTLARRESELKRKIEKLDNEIAAASQREKEAAELIKGCNDKTRLAAYEQLENNFICALCYDIMACPWSLNHPKCGHTFCAECILKWFFSGMHRACGTWHNSLDCPICRSSLVHPRPNPPRPDLSLPFSPNRLADAALKDLIATVAGDEKPKGTKKVKSSGKAKTASPWEAWALGESAHTDWLAREDRGRYLVSEVVRRWQTMNYDLLVITKDTLGV